LQRSGSLGSWPSQEKKRFKSFNLLTNQMYKIFNDLLYGKFFHMGSIFLLRMKFTVILLFTILQVNAASFGQKINLNVKDASIETVFKALREQSNYNFYYANEMIRNSKPITLSAANEPFLEVLEKCFNGQPFTFVIDKNTVVVTKRAESKKAVLADIIVKGSVFDEKGSTIPGVTIKIKGTSQVVSTKTDGTFSIKVAEDGILVVSYIGYKTQEVPVNNRKNMDITLQPTDEQLNEVVIMAYGQKQRKIETLGAQSTLNVEDLKQPVANISTVLAGRVSGLVGVQRSGEPGRDGADLWIRGVITRGNNTPLILVDGVERSFSNIDPNDIESFSILKDASSTAVYGVRGANGVILVNTKRGKPGRTDISVDYYQGVTNFTKLPETADGVTYMQMANEASTTRGGQPIYSPDLISKTFSKEDPYLYPNVNWFEEIFNDFGHNRKANLSIRGGNEKSSYYVSAGYYDETGLFKVDGLQQYNSAIKFSRVNFSSALTLKATKSTTIDLGIKGWISNGNYPGTGTSTIFANSLRTYPILYPTMYPDNKEPFLSTGGGLNSSYALLTNRGYSNTYENQVMSDIRVNQDLGALVKGLSAHVLYSFDATNTNSLSRLKTPTTYYATKRDENGELVYTTINQGQDYLSFARNNGGSRQFYLEGAVNYSQLFGKHKLGAMALYYQSDKVSATAGDLIGSIPYRSLGAVGRLTYSYNDRYLAESTFGYNGAENFAPSKRYGFFPSFALGWVISNEKFYGDASKIFQLVKLRGSYGIVGSSNIGGRRFSYVGTVGNTDGSYNFGLVRGDNALQGIDIADYAVDATWETETDLNLGLEIKTFNNALSLELDVFKRKRENIFLPRGVVPSFLGIRNNLLGNLGLNEAKGFDFTGSFNKRYGAVDLSFEGTFTYNKNIVIEDDSPAKEYPWLETRGRSVYTRLGYIADGFYTQAEIDDSSIARTAGVVQAGDLKFRDLSGDGVINADDQTFIGRDQVPQILYGFGTSIGYKGFSLGAFFQGVGSVDFYFANEFMPFRNGSAKGSLYNNILDRWTPENPRQDAFYPRLSYGADINQNYSTTNSHFLMNGKFLRLKTLDFGYSFPKRMIDFAALQKLRLYFIGYNLFTISPFKYWDPELGGGSGTSYPNIKTFSLGLSATF
jgi:TonB-linked SusC/RagA family outer membrane protein